MRSPILKLRGDNFTDPSRTPWGGDRVASWKRDVGIAATDPLGESWEVSFGPELPSFVEGPEARSLLSVVSDDLPGYLGDEAALGTSALLVKLLDARTPLSVQIHPSDRDETLGPGESGKPECWYVAAAEPGAGVLFGLADDATPAGMREALETGADLVPLLARIEVKIGDFFVVPPGTPHAIGAGVTVVEPQHITPNKRGVTYRYWDWNRKYDALGQLDPSGRPRALQVDAALRVTDWSSGRGSLLAERAYRYAPTVGENEALHLLPLSGDGGIPFSVAVQRLAGSGAMTLPSARVARSITVIEGSLRASADATFVALRGESLLIAAHAEVALEGTGVIAIVASTPPSVARR